MDLDKQNVHEFGNSLLAEFSWNNFQIYQEQLVSYCLHLEKKNTIESNISVSSKHNLWESKFNFLESDDPGITELKMWIIQTCQQYINTLNNKNYKFIIAESWAHVTREGGYHLPHAHPGSTWSGIFYIDSNGTSGKTYWQSPYSLERKPGLEFIKDTLSCVSTPGKLLLFPSMITHFAEPYLETSPRIVVAFNAACINYG
jgi:uncharacterized protein (TIGR02466 family)